MLVSLADLADEDTQNHQHAVECFQSASLSLASWTVLAEELHRKRVGRIIATHPFSGNQSFLGSRYFRGRFGI